MSEEERHILSWNFLNLGLNDLCQSQPCATLDCSSLHHLPGYFRESICTCIISASAILALSKAFLAFSNNCKYPLWQLLPACLGIKIYLHGKQLHFFVSILATKLYGHGNLTFPYDYLSLETSREHLIIISNNLFVAGKIGQRMLRLVGKNLRGIIWKYLPLWDINCKRKISKFTVGKLTWTK